MRPAIPSPDRASPRPHPRVRVRLALRAVSPVHVADFDIWGVLWDTREKPVIGPERLPTCNFQRTTYNHLWVTLGNPDLSLSFHSHRGGRGGYPCAVSL